MVRPGRGGSQACQGDGQEGALHRVGRGGVWVTQQCLLPTVCSWGWLCCLRQEHLYSKPVVLKLERASESSGGFDKTQVVRFSRSGVGPKICISNKLLGKTDAAGPGARLRPTAWAFRRSNQEEQCPPKTSRREGTGLEVVGRSQGCSRPQTACP